jgi:hypothetical protein
MTTSHYIQPERRGIDKRQLDLQNICLQLAALGHDCHMNTDRSFLSVTESLLRNYKQQRRLLIDYRCPADQRIQNFLNDFFKRNKVDISINLPGDTFNLNQAGLAREMSLPFAENHYKSPLVESYRIMQGVLHNPVSDRRTTQGVFHIVEGGLPIPLDKRAVPVSVYAKMLQIALDPPDDFMEIPITTGFPEKVNMWVSLLLRPTVRPEVKNVLPVKTMEIRMFAPGSLVSNLDFVESIFGNGGDPYLPENDAALDIEHWTGHSGCIILAPHLTRLTKKELGLPHCNDATERQRNDGMCWIDDDERYNNGQAFKVVCRDMDGVVVTIIADNYFGYSKKEVKSQISYSANLFGGCEEEHAGGALTFPCFNLGEVYFPDHRDRSLDHTFQTVCHQLGDGIEEKPEGYAIDKTFDDIIYISENTKIDMQSMQLSWPGSDRENPVTLPLLPMQTYIYPNGFRVAMLKHPHAPSWRLIGTLGEGTFCHKPSTVSGGGKSEISKSLQDLMISGPFFVKDLVKDLDQVEFIINYDFSKRFRDKAQQDDRSLLNTERTLGSVIRLLTPSSSEYTDEYNEWLASIPANILALVYLIKRFYKQSWGKNWRSRFSVDEINGVPGHELKFDGRKLEASYLRIGTHTDGTWRLFKLRHDFVAAHKVQMEDDISASTVVPTDYLTGLNPDYTNPCVKLIQNCESFLFQRPDEAIHRGIDKQTETDFAGENLFVSNFQPLKTEDAIKLTNDMVQFEQYTQPMQNLIKKAAEADKENYFASSAHPRLVNGKPTLNVRYLQPRPDLVDAKALYLAHTCTRLARGLSYEQPVYFPVSAVLQGRRNNPQDKQKGIRSLAVYNPIHYQELPELFMDLICSLTGKSPSTTGAGSEGALTKGPFNSLSSTADLNTALVSFILCGHDGFSSAAGFIGQEHRIDHDISMLIPEIWCRIPVKERDPEYLIAQGYFEKIDDFDHNEEMVFASRLGYRMTERFVHAYFGKVFDRPMIVFDDSMLRPEIQDLDAFVDGVNNIVEAQQRVAEQYIKDQSIHNACPPLKALLYIMAEGHYKGKKIDHPEIRSMFTRDYLINSDWYAERLKNKQQRDLQLWQMNYRYVQEKLEETLDFETDKIDHLNNRLKEAERMLGVVGDSAYFNRLKGTLGADWVNKIEPA